MDSLRQDLRFALRGLRRTPAVNLLIVGSLALAVAGNTTVFSIVNGILFRPLPYAEPDRIVLVGEYQQPMERESVTGASTANFLDWRERQTTMSAMAAFTSAPANLGAGEDRGEPVTVASVTPEFFPLLGVRPLVGRAFLPDEGTPGRGTTALLAYDFWQRRFAGEGEVVGNPLALGREAYTVVGVLPPEFEFLFPGVDVYVPLTLDPAHATRRERSLLVVGRLAPGVTTQQADAEMENLGRQLAREHPEVNRGFEVQALNLRNQVPDSRNRRLFALLQGSLLFVLLIACANIANLLLARGQSRRTEVAVRSALGAGSVRIARQLATESMILALAGGILGLALGAAGVRLTATTLGSVLPRYWHPVIDVRVLLFSVAITIVGGMLFGLTPALQAARLDIGAVIREDGRGGGLSRRRRLLSAALVVSEIALALVFLGGSSVLVRSFVTLRYTDPGFETADLLTVELRFPEAGFPDAAERAATVDEILRRLAGLPGVEAVTAANIHPRFPAPPRDSLTFDTAPPVEGQAPPSVTAVSVAPGFFAALGIPLAGGRTFDSGDRPGSPPVAVINQAAAGLYGPAGDPVGQSITVGGRPFEVVGVIADVNHNLFSSRERAPAVYLPLGQTAPATVVFALRAAGDPTLLARPARAAVLGADPGLVVSQVRTLEAYVSQFFVGMRVFNTILSTFSALALLLAGLGTYGVLAFAVAQRRHEIGVRMAMGARRGRVVAQITREGLLLAAVGLGLGIPGVLAVTRLISRALSDFVTVEPATVLVAAAVLAAVTLVASLVPARKAASIDPLVALRNE